MVTSRYECVLKAFAWSPVRTLNRQRNLSKLSGFTHFPGDKEQAILLFVCGFVVVVVLCLQNSVIFIW